MVEGVEGKFGPGAAGDLGDGEEGTPVVGETVEGGGRKRGFAGFEGGEIVGGPTGQFAAEVGFDFGAVVVEAIKDLASLGFHEGDDDGAVMKRTGELADARQD